MTHGTIPLVTCFMVCHAVDYFIDQWDILLCQWDQERKLLESGIKKNPSKIGMVGLSVSQYHVI